MSSGLDPFNNFLVKASGPTAKAALYVLDDKKEMKDAFFKPYKSPANFFRRAGSIVVAPVCLAAVAVELLCVSIYCVFESLFYLCLGDTGQAAESIKGALICPILAVAAALAAIVSPLVNFIDFIGSCVTTPIENGCCEEEHELAGFGL